VDAKAITLPAVSAFEKLLVKDIASGAAIDCMTVNELA
jgi:hypothetical protein